MVADLRIAVTGGTGFVGSRLLAALRQGGHQVKALTRSDRQDGDGLCWIPGSLEDKGSLERLADFRQELLDRFGEELLCFLRLRHGIAGVHEQQASRAWA